MSAIVKASSGESLIVAQAQMLDLALRAAAQLKTAKGLLPETLKSEGEIVAVLLAGAELGIGPMASLRSLQVVRGKVIISYDLMIGLLRRAQYKIEWLVSSASKASLRLTAPDGSQHIEVWDETRAKKAGLWGNKGPWSQYPETMLKARCVSSAARAFAGEVLAGVYCEEAQEITRPVAAPDREADRAVDAEVVDMETGEVRTLLRDRLADCETLDEAYTFLRANAAKIKRAGATGRKTVDREIARIVGDAPESERAAVRKLVDEALGVQPEREEREPGDDSDDAGEIEGDVFHGQHD